MTELTTEERLGNLESGIVAASNDLYDALSDPEIDDMTSGLRERLNDLHKRLKTLAETAETAYNILAEPEE